MDEDYEILPHQLLSDLKNEVEALKKKITQPDAKAQELILEMESLKDSLHEMTSIFQKALEDMKTEGETSLLMKNLNSRIDSVVSQNETIARGMIAISDKLEDFMNKQTTNMPSMAPNMSMASTSMAPPLSMSRSQMPLQHTMGMPTMSGPSRMAPPMMEMSASGMNGSDDLDLPPPPPSMSSKRKGLFK